MLLQLIFTSMIAFGAAYAALAGGKAGKYAAILIVITSLLSAAPGHYFDIHLATWLIFGIDVVCFLCFALLAMGFNRGWLIWCSGLQLAAIVTQLAAIIAPDIAPSVYTTLMSFWCVPILAVVIIGISLDRQHPIVRQSV